jgi:hypothetical protein
MRFIWRKVRLQRGRDFLRNLTLNRKDVGQFAIKCVGPNMRIGGCVDQLHVDAHCVAAFLNAAFHDMRHAKLPGDFPQVFWRTFVMLSGCARDHLKISYL